MKTLTLISISFLFAACSKSEFAADGSGLSRAPEDTCGKEGQTPCNEQISSDDSPGLASQVIGQTIVTEGAASSLVTCGVDIVIGARHIYPDWERRTRSETINQALVLPDDATAISIKTVRFWVDDYMPYITLNDKNVLDLRKDPRRHILGQIDQEVDLSDILKAGANKLYVQAFNTTSVWTARMQIKGTFKTAGECKYSAIYNNK